MENEVKILTSFSGKMDKVFSELLEFLMDEKNKNLLKQENKKNSCGYGMPVIPGVIRIRDAPFYLGMNKNIFRKEVSPFLTKFPIGANGKGIARAELDLWITYMKAKKGERREAPPWEIEENSPANTNNKKLSSPYSREQSITAFNKLVKKITTKKQE